MYRFFSALSLDVVFGCVISYLFFARFLNLQTNAVSLVILSLSVWIVYSLDHLADLNPHAFQSTRRNFILKNKALIQFLVFVALALNIFLIFFLHPIVLRNGLVICGGVTLYLLSMHLFNWKKYFHKELSIAVLYCAGVLVDPLSRFNSSWTKEITLVILAFFLIVLSNLLLFAILDFEEDKQAKFPSLPQTIGFKRACQFFIGLSFATPLVFILLGNNQSTFILTSMFAILQFLFWRRQSTFVKANFRYLGDGIFYLPVLGLI